MRNKKRDLNGYKKQLGKYRLTRKDIMILEKILWEYADAREMQLAKVEKLPEGRKHMPRKFADRCTTINGVSVDSVKFLPVKIKKAHNFEVACKPGITIAFTHLKTTIYAQTNYATGKELMVLKKTVNQTEDYISKLPGAILNTCWLTKH